MTVRSADATRNRFAIAFHDPLAHVPPAPTTPSRQPHRRGVPGPKNVQRDPGRQSSLERAMAVESVISDLALLAARSTLDSP